MERDRNSKPKLFYIFNTTDDTSHSQILLQSNICGEGIEMKWCSPDKMAIKDQMYAPGKWDTLH